MHGYMNIKLRSSVSYFRQHLFTSLYGKAADIDFDSTVCLTYSNVLHVVLNSEIANMI
jgi:hypothetical protein